MSLRVEVLGFAGAAPLQGACPSYLLSDGATNVLLDCGPGTLARLWQRELLDQLDAIVISHMHADHIADLLFYAGDFARSLLTRRPLLYVPCNDGPAVLERLHLTFARSANAPDRFAQTFELREYDATSRLQIAELSLAFAATEHGQQPCFAARVSDADTVVVYGADSAWSPKLAELATGADLLILEATMLEDERAAAEQRHLTANQAGRLAAASDARRLLLTHTLAGVAHSALIERAREAFSGPVDVATEGYVFPS
jgi:ribonuclease BN (tRNA processing enzyme)